MQCIGGGGLVVHSQDFQGLLTKSTKFKSQCVKFSRQAHDFIMSIDSSDSCNNICLCHMLMLRSSLVHGKSDGTIILSKGMFTKEALNLDPCRHKVYTQLHEREDDTV